MSLLLRLSDCDACAGCAAAAAVATADAAAAKAVKNIFPLDVAASCAAGLISASVYARVSVRLLVCVCVFVCQGAVGWVDGALSSLCSSAFAHSFHLRSFPFCVRLAFSPLFPFAYPHPENSSCWMRRRRYKNARNAFRCS